MKGISRKLINQMAESDIDEFAQAIELKVNSLVSLAVQDLSTAIPFIKLENCILQAANETINGGMVPESEYIYLLGFNSPQIEINCMQYNDRWKKFKERLADAWINTKRKKKKKKKKGQTELTVTGVYDFDSDKYNIDKLIEDLQTAFVRNLTTTSIVYNQGRFLRVIGRDEFGPKTQILIYPTIWDGETTFKFFISRKKGFLNIDFKTRVDILNEKTAAVGENFIKLLKIFNSLFRSASRSYVIPNEIFIETLLFNCPNELFKGNDIYDVFIKIVNYLNMTDVSQFKSILSPDKTVSEDRAIKSNQLSFMRFLNSLNEISDIS